MLLIVFYEREPAYGCSVRTYGNIKIYICWECPVVVVETGPGRIFICSAVVHATIAVKMVYSWNIDSSDTNFLGVEWPLGGV